MFKHRQPADLYPFLFFLGAILIVSALGLVTLDQPESNLAAVAPPVAATAWSQVLSSCVPVERCQGLHGMQIELARGGPDEVIVATTGAVYVIKQRELEMWRRLDPATNDYAEPKMMARLNFDQDLGPLAVLSANAMEAKVRSPKVELVFNNDSFFTLEALANLKYTHTHLGNAEYHKVISSRTRNKFWAGPDGGSLHAQIAGSFNLATVNGVPTFDFRIGHKEGHMIFPPRPFDFEKLYGPDAKPFNYVAYNHDGLDLGQVGTIIIFATDYRPGPSGVREAPVLVDSPSYPYQILGYEYDPAQKVEEYIAQAHAAGMKVITYLTSPYFAPNSPIADRWVYPAGHPLAGQVQPAEVTLAWMREFKEAMDLDGWYLDGFAAGPTILDHYNFMKTLRRDVGPEGAIFLHRSADPWSGLGGLRAIFVDTYADSTLAGEIAGVVHTPNDQYFRYISSGYGLSQNFGAHKLSYNDISSITQEEKRRVMIYDLNGLENLSFLVPAEEQNEVFDLYQARRAAYQKGRLAVSWPVDALSGWFRSIAKIYLEETDQTVVYRWPTPEPSTTELAWTPLPEDWVDAVTAVTKDIESPVTMHQVVLEKDALPADYRLRFRSRNDQSGLDEVTWGAYNPTLAYCGDAKIDSDFGEDCDDGNDERYDGCFSCQTTPSYKVFVTGRAYQGAIVSGDYRGLAAADRECALNARAAGFSPSSKWKAWLSDENDSAAARLYHSTRHYLTATGKMVAQSWSDLIDGSLQQPINESEFGTPILGAAVWTGTGASAAVEPNTCVNWTSAEPSEFGMAGLTDYSNSGWTARTGGQCGEQRHLYCFEQPWCGNGVVDQASEQCDDGNTANDDQCSNVCRAESGGGGSPSGADTFVPIDSPASTGTKERTNLNFDPSQLAE